MVNTFWSTVLVFLSVVSSAVSKEYLTKSRYGTLPDHTGGVNYRSQFGPKVKFPSVSSLVNRKYCKQLQFEAGRQGKIYKDAAGHIFFEYDDCKLRRLTSTQAKDCLSGMRIAVLGDSVTRYQYLSLVHFLASGQYHHPYDDGVASVSNNMHWGSWEKFYDGVISKVSKLLPKGGVFECKDCYHSSGTVHEHWHFELPESEDSRKFQLDFSYIYNKSGVVKSTAEGMRWAVALDPAPQYIIVNQGIFMSHGPESRVLQELKPIWSEGIKLSKEAKTEMVWKTCTQGYYDKFADKIAAAASKSGWLVYDVRPVLQAAESQGLRLTWYSGSVHLFPVAYEQFNDILLNTICSTN